MHSINKIHLRLARESDFQQVLRLSEGIYGNRDYIPVVFHDLLKTPNKLCFLAELQGEVVAFNLATIASDGKTFIGQALRIDPKYRGQGLSYQIILGVIEYIRRLYPEVSRKLYRASGLRTPQTLSIAKRLGDTIVKEYDDIYFKVIQREILSQEISNRFKKLEEKTLDLYPYHKSDAASIITSKDVLDIIAPHKVMLRDWEPYEAIPSNIKYIFQENDKVFADVTTEELKQGKIPRSFSHGCSSPRVGTVLWTTAIYANDLESFRGHVLWQLKSATKIIEKDFMFEVRMCSEISTFDAKRVLEEELVSLKQSTIIESDTVLLVERILKH